MNKLIVTAVLAAFSSEASAVTCENNVLPDALKVPNVFLLQEPPGCEAAKVRFMEIRNNTPWCVSYRWTGSAETTQVVSILKVGEEWVVQNGVRTLIDIEVAIPMVIFAQNGLPVSCAPPYTSAWSMAPVAGQMLEATAYDGIVATATPRPVPLLNNAPALFVGMGANSAERSDAVKIWRPEPSGTNVGDWPNPATAFFRFQ